MSDNSLSIVMALGATLSFAAASMVFTQYSRQISVLWMNCFKAAVGFVAVMITLLGMWLFTTTLVSPTAASVFTLLLSGAIGLCIGDIFLLDAFTRLGAARTLMVFGFSPVFVGIGAYFVFRQPLDWQRMTAVFFMIACLFTFSLEKFRSDRHWGSKGLVYAVIAVALDSFGILLTRWAYGATPNLPAVEAHAVRSVGALLCFAAIAQVRPFRLWSPFMAQEGRARRLIFTASLAGTYLALLLSLSAVKLGHLASVTAVSITGPMFAAALECFHAKRLPSPYLFVAFSFFAGGFWILFVQ